MARRDVLHYYYEIQNSYLEVANTVKELEESYKKGNIDKEHYDLLLERLEEDVLKQKEEYEALSYVIFLLNIPVRPQKGKKYEKENETYFKYLKKYSLEEKINENANGLNKIKEIIKETLKENKDG